MMNDERWAELQQAEDMAYFRADLCCYSPESYSLEEKKEICNDMISTSKAILDAIRADFEQLPVDARSKLLDMLCASGVGSPNGGGMSSSAKATRCTGSLRLSRNCRHPIPEGSGNTRSRYFELEGFTLTSVTTIAT